MSRKYVQTVSNGHIISSSGDIGSRCSGASCVSMSAWVRLSGTLSSSGANDNRIFSITSSGGSTALMMCIDYSDATNRKLRIGARSKSTDSFQATSSSISLRLAKWHHIAGVVDYGNARITSWIDGRQSASASATFGQATYGMAAGGSEAEAIGSAATIAATQFCDGLIADVAIWRTAVHPGAIALMARGVRANRAQSAGLIFHLTMDNEVLISYAGGPIKTTAAAGTVIPSWSGDTAPQWSTHRLFPAAEQAAAAFYAYWASQRSRIMGGIGNVS